VTDRGWHLHPCPFSKLRDRDFGGEIMRRKLGEKSTELKILIGSLLPGVGEDWR
jgi:hypothetical protein